MEEAMLKEKYLKYLDSVIDNPYKSLKETEGFHMEMANFHEGLAIIKVNHLYGFVNKDGEVVIQPQFWDAKNFSEGLAAVKTDGKWHGKWGYIDKNGEIVIQPRFYDANDFQEGFATVKISSKYCNNTTWDSWGYVDKDGEMIASGFYYAFPFNEGIARACNRCYLHCFEPFGKTLVCIDQNGKRDLEYAEPLRSDGSFHEGLAVVGEYPDGDCRRERAKEGYIDKTGKLVIGYHYAVAGDFHEGLAAVKKANKWGFINKCGEEVIPFQYDNAGDFHEGLAAVKKANKWGYINECGKQVIPFQYDSANDFHEGLAAVTIRESRKYIDKTGKIVSNRTYKIRNDETLKKINDYKITLWGYRYYDSFNHQAIRLDYIPVYDYGNFVVCQTYEGLYLYHKLTKHYSRLSSSTTILQVLPNLLETDDGLYYIGKDVFKKIIKNDNLRAGFNLSLLIPEEEFLSFEEFCIKDQTSHDFQENLNELDRVTDRERVKAAVAKRRKWEREKQKKRDLKIAQLKDNIKALIEQYYDLGLMEQTHTIKIPITNEVFLEWMDNYFEINVHFQNESVLSILDLSLIDFTNVRVRYLKLSNPTARINPQTVYKKDMSGATYRGLNFNLCDFEGVNICGSNFSGCAMEFALNLDKAISNENTVLPSSEGMRLTKKRS